MVIYSKSGQALLYSTYTGENEVPYRLYLCLAHFIPSPSMLMQHMHQSITNDMIYFIYHVTILVHRSCPHLLFTVASVHRCQVLLKLYHCMRSLALKPPTCPSHLQPVRRAKPHLNLFHLDHMTPCHVLYSHMQ